MKVQRLFRVVIVAALSLILVGCGSNEQRFLDSARRGTSISDSDSTLVAVGEAICYEIVTYGSAQARSNFSESSYSSAEQSAIWVAATTHLCK